LQQQCATLRAAAAVVGSRIVAARGRGGKRRGRSNTAPRCKWEGEKHQGAHGGAWKETHRRGYRPPPRHWMTSRLAGEECCCAPLPRIRLAPAILTSLRPTRS
jgi:hypothetical protein